MDDLDEENYNYLYEEESNQNDHYLLSDGKTYIVILGVILMCGGIVVSNIFFPNQNKKAQDNSQEGKIWKTHFNTINFLLDPIFGQNKDIGPDGKGSKPFLHPTMKVRSLMDEDVESINEQITKITR